MAACANPSQLWARVAVRELSTDMRLKATTGLAEDDIPRRTPRAAQLLDIGDGRTPTDADGNVELPDAVRHVGSLASLINATCSGVDKQQPNSHWHSRCTLTTKNKTVDMINDQVPTMAPSEVRELFSEDRVQCDGDADAHSEEFLNSLPPLGVPSHRLRVRVGTPVMLPCNLSPTTGDVNSTRHVVAAAQVDEFVEQAHFHLFPHCHNADGLEDSPGAVLPQAVSAPRVSRSNDTKVARPKPRAHSAVPERVRVLPWGPARRAFESSRSPQRHRLGVGSMQRALQNHKERCVQVSAHS